MDQTKKAITFLGDKVLIIFFHDICRFSCDFFSFVIFFLAAKYMILSYFTSIFVESYLLSWMYFAIYHPWFIGQFSTSVNWVPNLELLLELTSYSPFAEFELQWFFYYTGYELTNNIPIHSLEWDDITADLTDKALMNSIDWTELATTEYYASFFENLEDLIFMYIAVICYVLPLVVKRFAAYVSISVPNEVNESINCIKNFGLKIFRFSLKNFMTIVAYIFFVLYAAIRWLQYLYVTAVTTVFSPLTTQKQYFQRVHIIWDKAEIKNYLQKYWKNITEELKNPTIELKKIFFLCNSIFFKKNNAWKIPLSQRYHLLYIRNLLFIKWVLYFFWKWVLFVYLLCLLQLQVEFVKYFSLLKKFFFLSLDYLAARKLVWRPVFKRWSYFGLFLKARINWFKNTY